MGEVLRDECACFGEQVFVCAFDDYYDAADLVSWACGTGVRKRWGYFSEDFDFIEVGNCHHHSFDALRLAISRI